MKTIFVDTAYWIAIVCPRDQWAPSAKAVRNRLGNVLKVTTDEVLTEFLTALGGYGPRLRRAAARMVRAILSDPNVSVIPQTRSGFLDGLRRYENREDKRYSLTDCISMNVMESESLSEVLTSDHNFEQEGFTVLMKRDR